MRYGTKYVEIEAHPWDGDWKALSDWAGSVGDGGGTALIHTDGPEGRKLEIKTLEGTMLATLNDFIICGLNGEFYPCKPDIFNKKYRRAEPSKGARSYPFATPRCWKNKENSQLYKVVPWFQPIDNDSRIDFVGLFKEIEPNMLQDVMGDMEIYSGLVMQLGYLVESENRMWFGLIGGNWEEMFEDIEPWNEAEHRPNARNMTVEGISEANKG